MGMAERGSVTEQPKAEESARRDIEAMLDADGPTISEGLSGGRRRGGFRTVAVGVLASVLAAAVLCLALQKTREDVDVLEQVTQACPPPCVPHVFSQREEAELTGSLNKGKIGVPSGNEAVEEAMRAATDANGQIQLAQQSTAPNTQTVFQTQQSAMQAAPQSQWAKMHSPVLPEMPAESMIQAPTAPQVTVQEHAYASSHSAASMDQSILGALKKLLSSHDSRAHEERPRRREWDEAVDDREDRESQLRDLSKPQLRSLVRALLRPRDEHERSHFAAEEPRDDGVHRLRTAMDELVARTEDSRRDGEEDEGRRGGGSLEDLLSSMRRRRSGRAEEERRAEEAERQEGESTSAVLKDLLHRLQGGHASQLRAEDGRAARGDGGREEELANVATGVKSTKGSAEGSKEKILQVLKALSRKAS